jgi:hypothetical protein
MAASDFVKLEPPDEVPDQQEEQQQQQGQSQFGLNQSFGSLLDTGSTPNNNNNYENCLKEQKLMIEKLEVFLSLGFREQCSGSHWNCLLFKLIILVEN